MTTTILTIVITLMAVSMFFIKREYKIMVLWFSLMCCSQFPELNTIGVLLNVPTCLFLSEYGYIRSSLHNFNKPWIKTILVVIIISMIILYFTSPHYCYEGGIKGALSIFVFELIRKYFFILYALVCVTGWGSAESLVKVTTFAIIILTLFGIWDLVVGHSVYNEFLLQGQQNLSGRDSRILSDNISENGRWHIHSLFKFTFDYGFTCLVSLLLGLLASIKNIVPKKQCLIIILCSLFGVVMCGCRSVWITAAVVIVLFIMIVYSFGRGVVIISSLSILLVILYNTVPQIQFFYTLAGSAFEKDADYGGSSLEQRQRSYEAAFFYWQNNKVCGNGKDFFVIDLGYGEEELKDKDLAGLEGVMMNLLIERGVIGIAAYLIFYIVLLIHIYKLRYVDKETAACALSILIAYILFANFTGELKSVPPTLFIIGALLKILFLSEENYKSTELEPIET